MESFSEPLRFYRRTVTIRGFVLVTLGTDFGVQIDTRLYYFPLYVQYNLFISHGWYFAHILLLFRKPSDVLVFPLVTNTSGCSGKHDPAPAACTAKKFQLTLPYCPDVGAARFPEQKVHL